jgi:hypothetical protein
MPRFNVLQLVEQPQRRSFGFDRRGRVHELTLPQRPTNGFGAIELARPADTHVRQRLDLGECGAQSFVPWADIRSKPQECRGHGAS